jgi:hypothetical protein
VNGLPDPRNNEASRYANHEFKGGARPYDGHSGSVLDEPSKTIKAGAHGVPGGENMLMLDDGSLRYYTVRESDQIISPDSDLQKRYEETWMSIVYRQIQRVDRCGDGKNAAKHGT